MFKRRYSIKISLKDTYYIARMVHTELIKFHLANSLKGDEESFSSHDVDMCPEL